VSDPTVAVYEARAVEWRREREANIQPGLATSLATAARAVGPGPLADLGCGPGWYTAGLGPGAVALDATQAMLDQVPDFAPDAHRVRADLAALPFRRGALGGAFASKSYVHVAQTAMPMALADLQRSTAVGAPVELVLFPGDLEHGPFEGDSFAGRHFSLWPEARLRDVILGAGFTIERFDEVAANRYVDRFHIRVSRAPTLADTVGPGMRLLVCGLNPSVYSADAGLGFARPGNRFWPAMLAAGLAARDRDPGDLLRSHAIGLTDLVKRATRAAAELTTGEYREGLARVTRLVAWLRPGAVCFVGLDGWRRAVDRRAVAGPQPRDLDGVPVYVMPSTSGLNAHSRLDDLTGHLVAAAEVADRSKEPSSDRVGPVRSFP
jgi:TDG/mug DNA glycosylase family protein